MIGIARPADRRWWWTGAIAAVVALWTWSLLAQPPLVTLDERTVFAYAAFVVAHGDVTLAEDIGTIAFLVAYFAGLLHVIGAVVFRASERTPFLSSVLVALGALTLVPAGTAYVIAMRDFDRAAMTWWPPVLLGSAVVMAVAGVLSWRIAQADRRRGP